MTPRPRTKRKFLPRARKESLFIAPVWQIPLLHYQPPREEPGVRQFRQEKPRNSKVVGVAPLSEDFNSGIGRFSRRREDLTKLSKFLKSQGISAEEVPYKLIKNTDEFGPRAAYYSYFRLSRNGVPLTHDEIQKLAFDPAEIKKGGSYRRLK